MKTIEERLKVFQKIDIEKLTEESWVWFEEQLTKRPWQPYLKLV